MSLQTLNGTGRESSLELHDLRAQYNGLRVVGGASNGRYPKLFILFSNLERHDLQDLSPSEQHPQAPPESPQPPQAPPWAETPQSPHTTATC